jgi:hypothetical protein
MMHRRMTARTKLENTKQAEVRVGRRGEPAVLAEENQRMGVIKLREEG